MTDLLLFYMQMGSVGSKLLGQEDSSNLISDKDFLNQWANSDFVVLSFTRNSFLLVFVISVF